MPELVILSSISIGYNDVLQHKPNPETRNFLLKSAGILDLGVVQLPGQQTRLSRNDGKNTSPLGLALRTYPENTKACLKIVGQKFSIYLIIGIGCTLKT